MHVKDMQRAHCEVVVSRFQNFDIIDTVLILCLNLLIKFINF